MQLSVNTQSTNGSLQLYIINGRGIKILTVSENEGKNVFLVPGQTYRFEWHVWAPISADYEINAEVTPENDGFKNLSWKKSYSTFHDDMSGFYFTLNQ